MRNRLTQSLLAAIVVVLVVHLFREPPTSRVQAGGANCQVSDVLRARSLEIVDDRGRVRASIKLHPANPKVVMPNGKTQQETVILRLIDENGRPSVKLACSINGAALMVASESDPGYARIMSDLGTSTLTLQNHDGSEKVIKP
ncbi:MAG TPA: hypothetical protein VG055_07810 [Planctomycetaceae bacterium]|nr:hypothetical protein [Planctomycetaceae bacterium]